MTRRASLVLYLLLPSACATVESGRCPGLKLTTPDSPQGRCVSARAVASENGLTVYVENDPILVRKVGTWELNDANRVAHFGRLGSCATEIVIADDSITFDDCVFLDVFPGNRPSVTIQGTVPLKRYREIRPGGCTPADGGGSVCE